jgi:hypothetical protein
VELEGGWGGGEERGGREICSPIYYSMRYLGDGWMGGREDGSKLEKDWKLNWRVLALNDKIVTSFYNIHTFDQVSCINKYSIYMCNISRVQTGER